MNKNWKRPTITKKPKPNKTTKPTYTHKQKSHKTALFKWRAFSSDNWVVTESYSMFDMICAVLLNVLNTRCSTVRWKIIFFFLVEIVVFRSTPKFLIWLVLDLPNPTPFYVSELTDAVWDICPCNLGLC